MAERKILLQNLQESNENIEMDCGEVEMLAHLIKGLEETRSFKYVVAGYVALFKMRG